MDRKLSIGAKRNAACELARGLDRSLGRRRLVSALARERAGARPARRRRRRRDEPPLLLRRGGGARLGVQVRGPAGAPWVAGNTLAYRRDFWERISSPTYRSAKRPHSSSGTAWPSPSATSTTRASASPRCTRATTSNKETGGRSGTRARRGSYALLGDDRTSTARFAPPAARSEWPLAPAHADLQPPPASSRSRSRTFSRRIPAQGVDRRGRRRGRGGRRPRPRPAGPFRTRDWGPRLHRGEGNVACALAEGEIIAHWDDDDWYAPTVCAIR